MQDGSVRLVVYGAPVVIGFSMLVSYDPNFAALVWPLAAGALGVAGWRHRANLPPFVQHLLPPPPAVRGHLPSMEADSMAEKEVVEAITSLARRVIVTPPPAVNVPTHDEDTSAAPSITYHPGERHTWVRLFGVRSDLTQLAPIDRPIGQILQAVIRACLRDGLMVDAMRVDVRASSVAEPQIALIHVRFRGTPSPQLLVQLTRHYAEVLTQDGAAVIVVGQPRPAPARIIVAPTPQRIVQGNGAGGTVAAAVPSEVGYPVLKDDGVQPRVESLSVMDGVDGQGIQPVAALSDAVGGDHTSADLPAGGSVAALTVAPSPRPTSGGDTYRQRRSEPTLEDLLGTPPSRVLDAQELRDATQRWCGTAPIWRRGQRYPLITLGVDAAGQPMYLPLTHTAIFAPSQTGKTSLVVHIMMQLLHLSHPDTGQALLPWFATTKYEDVNQHGVPIGQVLRQAYNVRNYKTHVGIEPDGVGTYMVLERVYTALRTRLLRAAGAAQSFPVVVPFIDEWTVTAALLERMKRVNTEKKGDDKQAGVITGLDDGTYIVRDEPTNLLGQAALYLEAIIRQGLGMLIPLFLVTQDGQTQNTGLNTGLMGSFDTMIGHTRLEPATLQLMSRGNPVLAQNITQLRKTHDGWFVIDRRQGAAQPFWFPWVTEEVIRQWEAKHEALCRCAPQQEYAAPPQTPVASAPPRRMVTMDRWKHHGQLTRLGEDKVRALVVALEQCGVQLPLSMTRMERLALLGLGDNAAPGNPRLVQLLRLLRSKYSGNVLAMLLFDQLGQAAQDVNDACAARS